MKKSKSLLMILLIAIAMVACNKNEKDDFSPMVLPLGAISVVEANNGGNIECEEVGNSPCSSGRIDYTGGTGPWTVGPITWSTDGTYVTWSSSVPVKIAVIVKGGPNASVYKYNDECTTGGTMLTAPINPNNGKPYGLSNITFCYSECEQPDLVIALKTYLLPGENIWAASRGTGSATNSLNIGYNAYVYNAENIYNLYRGTSGGDIGSISATDYMENNIHYLEVVIDTDDADWMFGESFLYVGSAEGYENYLIEIDGVDYSQFRNFPFTEDEYSGVRTFKIPFSEITE